MALMFPKPQKICTQQTVEKKQLSDGPSIFKK